MEMVKPKKKKGKSKDLSQENVPLHDILNTDSAAEEGGKTSRTDSPKPKEKKTKKNEISPGIASSSITTVEEATNSNTKPNAWQTGGESVSQDEPETPKKKQKKGIVNPALSLADEAELPGSIPDLQDTTIDSMPAFSSAVASTIIDDDDEPNGDVTKEVDGDEAPRSRPSTSMSKSGSNPGASKFHRALFGRPKSATKVEPVGGKENFERPQTAPGYRVPFVTDFSPSPKQKRPATAAATGARHPKSGRKNVLESQASLRETSFNTSTRSLRDPPELEKPKQAVAYVPYTHARNALSRVIEDMKNMKKKHLSIVMQIEEQYHGIENDSREQFNTFVISLQDEQRNKIYTFRQTIEDYNTEIKERNKYWADTLQSLSKRNKELLRQKRALLLAYQADTKNLEEERDALQAQLLGQIGEQDSKLRILEGQLESRDNKIETDENESEKSQIIRAVPVGAAVAVAHHRSDVSLEDNETQTDGDFIVGAFTVVDENESKWKERYENEREEHREESERMQRELQQARALLTSSGSSSEEEREAYENKIKELAVGLAKKKIEYDTTYAFLQSIMAATDSEEQYLKAKKKIDDDRAMMLEEKEKIAKDIAEWEKKWKTSHGGKLPDENEKPDAAKEMDTQLSEVEQISADLDQQEKALIMLKEGRIPQPITDVPEPMVTTVEVRDPKLVAELETNKSQISFLEEKLKTAQDDLIKISDLENENVDLRDKIQRYEKEMDAMRRIPVTATVALGAAAAVSLKSKPEVNERDAATLLQALVAEVEVIHRDLKKAPQTVDVRMNELRELEEGKMKKRDLGGDTDDSEDESGASKQNLREVQLSIAALELLQRGELPDDLRKLIPKDAAADDQDLQEELDEARMQVDDLKMQLDEARLDSAGGMSPRESREDSADVEELMGKMEDYQKQIDDLEKDLENQKAAAEDLRAETEQIQSELDQARSNLEQSEEGINARVIAATAALTASLLDKEKELKECNARIDELDQARFQNLDVESRAEVERAQKEAKIAKTNVTKAKKEKEELEIQLATKEQKLKSLGEKITAQTSQEVKLRSEIDAARKEKQKAVKECETKFAEKERKRKAEEDAKTKVYENKFRRLEAAAAAGAAAGATRKAGGAAVVDPNMERKMQRMEAQLVEYKKQKADDQNRIRDLDRELKEAKASAKSTAGDKEKKAIEKKVKELEKKLEIETRKFERELKRANELSDELEQLKKDHADLEKKYKTSFEECEVLKVAAATGAEMAVKAAALEKDTKQLSAEVKTLTDNYNTERVLRKKYYNMIEDMKGKIRVYCRYRPMSKTELSNKNKPVVKAPDEYTVQVESRGSMKEFQFDQIFTSESSQEDIFEDTFNLVQSAVDGYNVCIFAYGQTGSGKTYTMIGDSGQTQPGVAPRAFKRIFDLIEENESKLRFEFSLNMADFVRDFLSSR